MRNKQFVPPPPTTGNERLAIEFLTAGLRAVIWAADGSADPRHFRAIALAALRDASRWAELPAEPET